MSIVCVGCETRNWDVVGCINNPEPEPVCLFCCGCPDHEGYWGSKCCGADWCNDDCECCMNTCDDCGDVMHDA